MILQNLPQSRFRPYQFSMGTVYHAFLRIASGFSHEYTFPPRNFPFILTKMIIYTEYTGFLFKFSARFQTAIEQTELEVIPPELREGQN